MTPTLRAAANKTIAVALALSIFLPPSLARAVSVEATNLTVRPAAGITSFGVVPLGTLAIPMTPVTSAFSNAGSVIPLQTAAQTVNAPEALPVARANDAIAARPVIDIINQMQAKGIAMPTTINGNGDASQWLAAASVLPEGAAKQSILMMAGTAAAGPAGKGMGEGLDKAYDGKEAGAASAPATPTFWDKVSNSRFVPNFLKKRIAKKAPEAAKPAAQLMPVDALQVPVDKARYTPELTQLPGSTREVQLSGVEIVGQDKALKSIRAGIEMQGPYYNLFISGADGSGRETALKAILAELAPKMTASGDLVAATNFSDPENPIFLNLGAGQAPKFAGAVKEFVRTYQMALPQALNSDQAKELKKGVNAELNKNAAERDAKFEQSIGKERIGKFGIKIMPEDAGDGEHFNFNVALTYSKTSPEAKAKLEEILAEADKINVKGFGVTFDEAGNMALTREANGKMVKLTPEDMAKMMQSGELNDELLTEVVKAATPVIEKHEAWKASQAMKSVSSEEELNALVKDGVFTMDEWNDALRSAKAAAEPYMDDFRAMISENRAEKMVAYQKMYQQIAAMLVQQIGKKVVASVMPNRHDTPAHKAWEQSAKERQEAILAEIAKVKVHGYGIMLDASSLATGNIGLSHEVGGEMVPLKPEELEEAQQSGALSADKIKDIVKAAQPLMKKLGALSEELDKEHKALHANDPAPTNEEKKAMGYAKALLQHAVADFQSFMPGGNGDDSLIGRNDPLEHYRIGVMRSGDGKAKVVFEDKPTLERLFGQIEPNRDTHIINGVAVKTMSPGGPTVKTGSILQADVIVMNAMDLLRTPGSWHAIMELVRTGQAEIPEIQGMLGMSAMTGNYHVSHKPKIILIGSPYIKMLLTHYDEDFQRGFNASAEFVQELDINGESVAAYVQFMKKMVIKGAGLIMDFDRGAMGAMLEYASFEAESNEKFTAQFGSIYNLMREASRLAKNANRKTVTREDVQGALADRKDGTSSHQKRYMELLEQRVFVVDTKGMKHNQANGLVVMGDFGAPARVTFVETASKDGGVISNDQSAHWTGHSMDKAFANVQGYYENVYGRAVENIRKRYSFEQTYGGLDGDSATGIKTALGELSMAGLPIRQDGAMTGSMDQLGNIQAIGGVNHKIEGLFDLLNYRGQLVPTENVRERAFVIVPRSNVSQLTLKPEVIQAIREKRFVIWGVDRIEQAEEILSYAPYAEVQRRVKAFSKHESLIAAAKAALGEKYSKDQDFTAFKAGLEKLEQEDAAWKAKMEAEAVGFRTAALAPKS